MLDLEFDTALVDKRPDARRQSGGWPILFTCLVFLGVGWVGLETSSSRRSTCAVCREDKTDRECLGLKWSEPTETNCSHWYRDNVEPTHAHVWVPYGRCRPIGFLGLGGVGCSFGPAITRLSMTDQMELYRHFEDRQEAKRIFLGLAGRGEGTPVLIEDLMIWRKQGYPGTWRDWWAGYGAKFE